MEIDGENSKRPISDESDDGAETDSAKRLKPTLDRLSELTDLAIVHILSQLLTNEAAQTSVLSKRFYSLWTAVHSLSFSNKISRKHIDVFVNDVAAALRFHRRNSIENFEVEFDYIPSYRNNVDSWLQFAVQKEVKSIHLIFSAATHRLMPWLPDSFMYKLPKIIYRNENIVELVTSCCVFPKGKLISCSRLKLLSIAKTRLNEELISEILGGCSVLETLELTDCTGFTKLKINSSSLRVLRVIGTTRVDLSRMHGPLQEDFVMEISGPNLVSLEVLGVLRWSKLRVTDIGSLVNAVIAFTPPGKITASNRAAFHARNEEVAKEVLEGLTLVKAVTIGGSIIKALSARAMFHLSAPWSERRSLTLCIPFIEWSQYGISSFLSSSPYLEYLVIRLSYCSDTCVRKHVEPLFAQANNSKSYWKSWVTISKFRLLHLKTVKIVGFQVSCGSIMPLFHFLEFLLSNSKVLEEIVIQAKRYVTRAALDEAMKLLSVPTASPDVVLKFEPPHLWVDRLCMYKEVVPLLMDVE